MELELGLKLTRAADDFTSNFQMYKDWAGPLFFYQETDNMFILTAHLKGYRRGNINIDISKDGNFITIRGERKVKETVIVGWRFYKTDTETKGFKKVFKIPDTVILDNIKANYNEEELSLTVSMPKKVKGILGTVIEEVEETADVVKQGGDNFIVSDENILQTEPKEKEEKIISESREGENREADEMTKKDTGLVSGDLGAEDAPSLQDEVQETISKSELPGVETEESIHEMVNGTRLPIEPAHSRGLDPAEAQNDNERVEEEQSDICEPKEDEVDDYLKQKTDVKEAEVRRVHGEDHHECRRKRCKLCTPIVAAGSAFILSFVVFVFHMVRSKNQTCRRKE